MIKNIYTADKVYESHIPLKYKKKENSDLLKQWKEVPVWNEDKKIALKLADGKDFSDLYKWISIPERVFFKPDDSAQTAKGSKSNLKTAEKKDKKGKVEFKGGQDLAPVLLQDQNIND